MTESEWLASSDPAAMLECLQNQESPPTPGCAKGPSDRKLRLFAVACCRQIWDRLVDTRSKEAIEAAENYADAKIDHDTLQLAMREAHNAWDAMNGISEPGLYPQVAFHGHEERKERRAACAVAWVAPIDAAEMRLPFMENVLQYTSDEPFKPNLWQAALLRDIFGNPWKPLIDRDMLDEDGVCCHCEKGYRAYCKRCRGTYDTCGHPWCPMCQESPVEFRTCEACHGLPGVFTPTVLSIAQAIYDERAFDRMPVLADTLEEAGCREETLLRHLRGEEKCPVIPVYVPDNGHTCFCECQGKNVIPLRGQHVRGCWALDLILGKE